MNLSFYKFACKRNQADSVVVYMANVTSFVMCANLSS